MTTRHVTARNNWHLIWVLIREAITHPNTDSLITIQNRLGHSPTKEDYVENENLSNGEPTVEIRYVVHCSVCGDVESTDTEGGAYFASEEHSQTHET